MAQQAIFQPFFIMMLLTFIVWTIMFARRIPFLQNSDIPPNQITPSELERVSPPDVSNPSHNLKNLFELPVLFYALILYLFQTSQVDAFYLTASWIFVGFRIAHSAVHCTVNIVLLRFALYLVSSITLWLMLGRAAITMFIQ